jgi:hypothetical protein
VAIRDIRKDFTVVESAQTPLRFVDDDDVVGRERCFEV